MVVSNISPGSGGIPDLCGAVLAESLRIFRAMVILDNWNDLKVGQRVNLVCQMVLMDCNKKHLVRILGSSELVVIYGDLDPSSQLWTFLQVKIIEGRYKHALQLDDKTFVFPHEPTLASSLTNCVELCSGAGFLSVGMKAAGYNIVAGVEQNSSFGRLYHENDLGQFVHGSVGDADSVKQVLMAGGQNATVAAGVACQPYSRAGDCKSGEDARASTLPQSLEFGWLLQAPVIIVECTPRALQDKYVQGTLKTFCQKAGYLMSQNLLHLEKCWASHRARWWCILSARLIGDIPFDDFPVMPEYQKVQAVMPYEKEWPSQDLKELVLSLYEHSKFHRYSQGLHSMILDPTKQMGTALHAWGNQCYPCACGCRPGFSEQRMQQRGLFATFIAGSEIIEREGYKYPVCRHMHPAEVALLCGTFPSIDWHGQLKLGLAAVGQMASPLQSCWVGAHVLAKLAEIIQADCVTPLMKLKALQKDILMVRDSMWPPKESAMPVVSQPVDTSDYHRAFVCDYASGCQAEFRFPVGSTVQHLIQAERALALSPQDHIWVLDSVGNQVGEDVELSEGEIYQVGFGNVPHPAVAEGVSRVDLDLPLDFQGVTQKPALLNDCFPPSDVVVSCHGAEEQPQFQFDDPNCVGKVAITPQFSAGNKAVSDEPLCQLNQQGLLQMIPPHAESDGAIHGLLAQGIGAVDRLTILEAQQNAWADDELRFHLTLLQARAPAEQNVVFWDPLHVTSACRYQHVPVQSIVAGKSDAIVTIITVVCIHQHWVPVLWRKDSTSLLAYSTNAFPDHHAALQVLHTNVCKAFDVGESPIQFRDVGTIGNTLCGVVAIEYLEHLLWGTPLALAADSLCAKHAVYRNFFRESLEQTTHRPWIWGLGSQDMDSQLTAILREHGVAANEVVSRIEMLKSKLGTESVGKAMTSHNPWRELKWMANQSIPPVQIIKPSELQSAIEARSNQQVPVGRKKPKGGMKGKGKGKSKDAQASVDPHSLRLENGIFVIDVSIQLSQIPLKSIGPAAQGIALVSLNEALPFLTSGKAVTEGGLGVIVLDMPAEIPHLPLISTKVIFPVLCAANSEPMLIEGHLYQLGHKPVTKATGGEVVKLTSIDTCVAKIAVFRDQIQGQWADVIQHPMKYVMHHVTMLSACQLTTCDEKCGHWHGDAAVRDPILEVWNRQWMTIGYAHCSPQEAEVFSVAVRLPKRACSSIVFRQLWYLH